MKLTRKHPWCGIEPATHHSKANYIPSHQRAGFSEKKVIKLPSYGEIQKKPDATFVISRDRGLMGARKTR